MLTLKSCIQYMIFARKTSPGHYLTHLHNEALSMEGMSAWEHVEALRQQSSVTDLTARI